MPELPEVETLRRDLQAHVVGSTIVTTTLGRLRSVRRYDDPQRFVAETQGASFVEFGRLGKYLYARLSTDEVLVVHLRMSGQVRLVESVDVPLVNHTHIRFTFRDGRELRFVDPRTFGEMWVTSNDLPDLAHLGGDALDVLGDVSVFGQALKRCRRELKGVLLDQAILAGIGSIYADEGCYLAGIRPTRPADSLKRVEVGRLCESLLEVLETGIAGRGSTLGDGQYVDMFGHPGTFAASHQVHARGGLPCFGCGTPLTRVIVAQRSAVFCPRCQK